MDELVSKSQKKREAEKLQKVGMALVELASTKLDKLPLPETLRRAIDEAKLIKSHGAAKRQGLYIGKLMRSANFEEILAAYEELKSEAEGQSAHFHELEHLREKLVHGGKEALTDFVAEHPEIDLQKLRQLIKKASTDLASDKNTGAMKDLFRFLRENV
jgi:ribosome-associated protein